MQTDRSPWGSITKAKWKQNVASAKAGLDHRGVVIRYLVSTYVPRKSDPTKFRRTVRAWRVLLGPHCQSIIAAVRQRDDRRRILKKRYRRLKQPKSRYVVPTPSQVEANKDFHLVMERQASGRIAGE